MISMILYLTSERCWETAYADFEDKKISSQDSELL